MQALRVTLAVLAGLAVGAGGFVAGRISAPTASTSPARYPDPYVAGLRAGEAQGLEEGRAGQEAAHLSGSPAARVRRAFEDGYAAGANDVFAGYDGGWELGAYVVTIARGSKGITYRITEREPLRRGVDYYRCSTASPVCQRPHR
jgi:hypothetical protein